MLSYRSLSEAIFSRSRIALGLVVVAHLALATWMSLHVPLFEAPDEYYHFAVIEHLTRTNHLPPRELPPPQVNFQFSSYPWRQMAFHAPLYYQIAAGLLRLSTISTHDFASYRFNPHAQIGIGQAQDNVNFIAHVGYEQLLGVAQRDPLSDTGLAVRLIRVFSLSLGALSLIGCYALTRACLLHRPDLAVLAAALMGFIPQFVFINGIASNDSLLVACSTWGLAWTAWSLRQPRWRLWWVGLGGALAGAAALSKASGLAVVVLCGSALPLMAWRGAWPWRRSLLALLLYSLIVLLIAAPWYANNWQTLGDLTAARLVAQATGLRSDPPLAPGEFMGLLYSFWGLFGWFNILSPMAFYHGVLVLCCVAGLGLLLRLRRTKLSRTSLLLMGVFTFYVLVIGAAWWQFNQLTYAAQGRLFFPLLGIAALLLALGLAHWPAWARALSLGGLGLACLLLPITRLAPSYAPDWTPHQPPENAIAFQLREPWQAEACLTLWLEAPSWLDELELEIVLHWRADCPISGYWSVFFHAIDDTRLSCTPGDTAHILAQHDTMPQGGRLPIPSLPIGRTIRDVYRLTVPSRATHLHLGLYDAAGSFIRAFVSSTAPPSSSFKLGRCAPELIEHSLKPDTRSSSPPVRKHRACSSKVRMTRDELRKSLSNEDRLRPCGAR
ncbi:MAG: hypothetical protein NZ750_11440 [Anaerolineae bacterium]|nr:hypothetical protein [Anaerolineae bacterium]MDW8174021.1 hypothetical protein [Anaerolineae bacterium]